MCRRRSSVPSDDRREIRCGASEIPRNQGNIRNATVILVTDVPSWSSSPIRPLSLASPSLSTLSVTWVDVFLSLSLSLALGPFSFELRPPERVLGLSLFDQLTRLARPPSLFLVASKQGRKETSPPLRLESGFRAD